MMQFPDQVPPVPQAPDPVIVVGPTGAPPWETMPPQAFVLMMLVVTAGAVIILWPLVRALARRLEGGSVPRLRAEIAELRARLEAVEHQALTTGEVVASDQRMYELEERVEFVERLLSRGGKEGSA